MRHISEYTGEFSGERGNLECCYRDAYLGRTLEWNDTLRGFYHFGSGEVVRAWVVRKNPDRFQPAPQEPMKAIREWTSGCFSPPQPTTTGGLAADSEAPGSAGRFDLPHSGARRITTGGLI